MSTKKRQRQSGYAQRKKSRPPTKLSSILIPVVVGLAVVAIIVYAIISLENQQQPAAQAPVLDNISVPIVTAKPQETRADPNAGVPRISVQDTKERMDRGEAVLVDVRSWTSYAQKHAEGAISIPEQEIDSRLSELPRDKDVVFY